MEARDEANGGGAAPHGIIVVYVHNGRVGAMVELTCETAAEATSDALRALARDVAQQVVACPAVGATPRDLSRAELPPGALASSREALLEQRWVRDSSITVAQLIERTAAVLGETVTVRRFVRYELGEDRGAPPDFIALLHRRGFPDFGDPGHPGGVREPRRPSPDAGGAGATTNPATDQGELPGS